MGECLSSQRIADGCYEGKCAKRPFVYQEALEFIYIKGYFINPLFILKFVRKRDCNYEIEALNEQLVEGEPIFCPPLALYFLKNCKELTLCHPQFHDWQEYI